MKLPHYMALAAALFAGCGRQEVSRTSTQPATPISTAPSASIAESAPSPVIAAATPAPRLAPEDVYYLLRPVSLTTESGVYSARAGSRMILVEKGARAWFVTNERGTEFAVHPSDLTNDLDVAAQFQKSRPSEAPDRGAVSTSPSATTSPGIDSTSQPALTSESATSAAPVAEPESAIASGADYITQHKIRTLRAQIYYSSQELATKQAQLSEVYGARDRGGSINRVYYYAGGPYSYAHSRRITSSNGSEFVLKKEIDLLNKKLDALHMQLQALGAE